MSEEVNRAVKKRFDALTTTMVKQSTMDHFNDRWESELRQLEFAAEAEKVAKDREINELREALQTVMAELGQMKAPRSSRSPLGPAVRSSVMKFG